MAKKYDVITIGSGLVDAFVRDAAFEKNGKIEFNVGEKIPVKIGFSSGGGGINTASCISKLGLNVGFIGKIGEGYNGDIILRELRKFGVAFLGVRSMEHTGYSIILVTDKNNRTILTSKGASDKLKFLELKIKKLDTKWIHFTSMKDESFKTQYKIMKISIRDKIKISFNPGIGQIKKKNKEFLEILRNTDFLSVNLQEAKAIVRKDTSFENLFKEIKKLGPKLICITNGEKEGGVYDGEFLYTFVPKKVNVKEVTGAGDSFTGSLLSGIIKSNNLEEAIKIAMINSESVIRRQGAKNGLLNMGLVKKELRRSKHKIKKRRL